VLKMAPPASGGQDEYERSLEISEDLAPGVAGIGATIPAVRQGVRRPRTGSPRSGHFYGKRVFLRAANTRLLRPSRVVVQLLFRDVMDALREFAQDIKYCFRGMTGNKIPALVTVLTLGLGIGVNTSIFTLINSVLFRPMPVDDPSSLFEIVSPIVDAQTLREFRETCRTCESVTSSNWILPTLGEAGEGPIVHGNEVPENYFEALRVASSIGRVFSTSDPRGDAADAIVLNHDFWQTQFGGNPGAIGQTIKLSGRTYTVIGVARKGFYGTMPLVANFWVLPGQASESTRAQVRALVRLRAGIPKERAEMELGAIRAKGQGTSGQTDQERVKLQSRATMIPINSGTSAVAGLLLVFTGLVLIVACANIANLALARSTTRVREMSIRLAVGASRARLIRQLLTESVVLSLFGGVFAIAVTAWTLPALSVYLQTKLPNLWGHWHLDLNADVRVFGFTAAICILAAIGFGLMPAFQSTNIDLAHGLKDGGKHGAKGTQSRLRGALVVLQISLCSVLLSNAGLVARALAESFHDSPGFETQRMLIAQLNLGEGETDRGAGARLFERYAAMPGVESVAAVRHVPLLGYRLGSISNESVRQPATLTTAINQVTANYFSTLAIPLTAGRSFSQDEQRSMANVAVISEAAARKLFGQEQAVGKTVRLQTELNAAPGRPAKIFTVVGIARDTRSIRLSETDPAHVYLPIDLTAARTVHFLLRARDGNEATTLIPAVRKTGPATIATGELTVYPFDVALGYQRLPAQGGSAISGLMGLLALALGTIGVYGVLSYSVAKRTGEIGVRIAMGATARNIRSLFLREGGRLVALGLAVGVCGAVPLAMMLRSLLPGIRPLDLPILLAVSLFLAAVTLLAAWFPAVRATRIEPLEALRQE
jgi:predicted permease